MSYQSLRLFSLIRKTSLYIPLLLCVFSLPSFAENNQLSGVKQEIARQLAQLKNQKHKESELQQALKSQETSIGRLTQEMRKLQKDINQYNRKITQLRSQITELEKQNASKQTLLATLIQAQYKQGKSNDLKLFFDTDTPANKDRLAMYAKSIQNNIATLIASIKTSQTTLNKQQQTLEKLNQNRQKELINKQTQHRHIIIERKKRQYTLSALKSKVKQNQSYISNLKKNEKELKQKLALVSRHQVKMHGLRTLKYKLPWPVIGHITHSFGQTQTGELKWKGLVINKEAGSTVKAIADGKIIFADWLRGYGLLLVIDHGAGDMSLYGYNQTLLKQVGDYVRQNDKIALVGDSGGQSQNALYFEIRRKGNPVNPRYWLEKR